MKIAELLDAVKEKSGAKTDGELARKLGLDKRRVSDYYNGKRAPDEFACLKISEITGEPLDSVIARVKAMTETDEKRREAWENYFKRLGGLAASFAITLCVTVSMMMTSTPANACDTSVSEPDPLYYVKFRLLSQVKAILRRIGQKFQFGPFFAGIRQMTA